ncbi:MAG: hypothetical protein AB1449_09955 [Chloroflexota bacterium]
MPTLPSHATAAQVGEFLYYYKCMACHGDRGQGLTDEWRAVWVEDHQNCWARGCHAGQPGDEGFPIPRFVPPVIEGSGGLLHFESAQDLAKYLAQAHPPQQPGSLSASDVAALTAFLLQANDRPVPQSSEQVAARSAAATGILLAAVLLAAWALARGRGDR